MTVFSQSLTKAFFTVLTKSLRLKKLDITVILRAQLHNFNSTSYRTVAGSVHDYKLEVTDELLDECMSAPWHMLSGKGLEELVIRMRSITGRVNRNVKSKGIVQKIKEIVGSGGEEEDGPDIKKTELLYPKGCVWKVTWWDEPPKG
jgi:hypothetical protein